MNQLKVGVFTQVHNEHNHLKEWIDYYLKLKFDKVIIYEDIYSNSHEEIIKPYGNNVILQQMKGNIANTLYNHSDCTKEEFYNQYTLRQNNVLYYLINEMKKLYNIDYCLFVDVDEFLTGDFDDIHDIANYCEYNGINSLRILWNNYSSSGYIKKPITSKPTYEIYNEVSCLNEIYNTGKNHNKERDDNLGSKSFCKIGYCDFYWAPHTAMDLETKSYTLGHETIYNLYVNHYIYKSYEEFVYQKIPNTNYRTRIEWWFGNQYDENLYKEQRALDKEYYEIRKNKALSLYNESEKTFEDKLQLAFNIFPYYLSIIIANVSIKDEEYAENRGIVTYFQTKENIQRIIDEDKYLIFFYSNKDDVYIKFMNLFNIYKHEHVDMPYLDEFCNSHNKVWIETTEFISKADDIIEFCKKENII